MTYKEKNAEGRKEREHSIQTIGMECFKDRLKEIIGTQSIKSFAREIKSSDGTVHNLLSGKGYPSLNKLIDIASAGDVTVQWLATGEPPKYTAELSRLLEVRETPGNYDKATPALSREQQIQRAGEVLKRSREMPQFAIEVVGYNPPPGIVEALKILIANYDISQNDVTQFIMLTKEALEAEK